MVRKPAGSTTTSARALPLIFLRLLAVGMAAALLAAAPGLAQSQCVDQDGDGYGAAGSSGCQSPGTDCNDGDPNINPGAAEICDGVDNDCDGSTDEGFDTDGDGFTTCGGDCDDGSASVNPSAPELCGDLVDNNCDGNADEGFVVGTESGAPPDPQNPADRYDCNDGVDNDGDGNTDLSDPDCQAAQCYLTDPPACCGGDNVPPGSGCTAADPNGCCVTLAFFQCDPMKPRSTYCADPAGGRLMQEPENGGAACSDARDNDCDGLVDLGEQACQMPEICNGLDDDASGREGPSSTGFDCLDGVDNDGDNLIDQADPGCAAGVDDDPNLNLGGVPLGGACSVGTGACARQGTVICDGAGGVTCSRAPGSPGIEGPPGSSSCFDQVDNDCDGETDFPDDPGCRGQERCDGIDNDGDGMTDEDFGDLTEVCTVGIGACQAEGSRICASSGNGTVCDAVPGLAAREGPSGRTCVDQIDNDCDGYLDLDDPDCASSELMVECKLPLVRQSPPNDCADLHEIRWRIMGESGLDAAEVTAELLGLDYDGNILAALPVQEGDWARMASRSNPNAVRARTRDFTKRNQRPRSKERRPLPDRQHEMSAPIPLLRVRVKDGKKEAVAYCSNVPYVQVVTPDKEVDTAQAGATHLHAAIPKMEPDSLQLYIDGEEVLDQLFPLGDVSCPRQAPCSGTVLVAKQPVQIRDLIIETRPWEWSSNTVDADIAGLECGAHTMVLTGNEKVDAFPTEPRRRCVQDDMADVGELGIFQITIDSPLPGSTSNPVPTPVTGEVCHGRPIAALSINGKDLDPNGQAAVVLDPNTAFERTTYILPIDTRLGRTDLARDLKFGDVALDSFDEGSNRVIADAEDDEGNRAFETVIFATGNVANPGIPSTAIRPGLPGGASDGVAGTSLGTSGRRPPAPYTPAPGAAGRRYPGARVEFDFPAGESGEADPEMVAQWEAALEGAMVGEYDQELKEAWDETFGRLRTEMATPGVEIDNAFVVGIKASAIREVFEAKCARAAVQFRDRVRSKILSKPPTTKSISVPCSCDPTVYIYPSNVIIDANDFTCPVTFQNNQFSVSINLPDVRIITSVSGRCTTSFLGACIARTVVSGTVETQLNDVFMRFNVTEDQLMGNPNPAVPFFDPGGAINIDAGASVDIQCIGGDICEGLVTVFTFGLVDISPDVDVSADVNFNDEVGSGKPDPIKLEEVKLDEATVMQFDQEAEGRLSSVEITPDGIVAGLKGRFKTSAVDPSVVGTPGAVITANNTLPSPLAPGTGDVFLAISDDVFNQLFASMRIAGKLNSGCRDSGKTVGDLLPFDCSNLTAASDGGTAVVQGICHGIRGDDCEQYAGPDLFKTPILQGVCHGTQGSTCTEIPRGILGTAWPADCESVTFEVPGADPNGASGPDRATAILQGVCHGHSGDDCEAIAGANDVLTAVEQGACHAAQGAACQVVPAGLLTGAVERGTCTAVSGQPCNILSLAQFLSCTPAKVITDAANLVFDFEERKACEITPARDVNLGASDPLMFCTTTDMPPRLLIQDDASTPEVVETGIRLNDLSVAMLVDRNSTTSPGLDGALSATPGCFDEGAPKDGDCLIFGVCLDLNFVTDMRFDNKVCAANKPGLKTSVRELQTTVRSEGVVCGAPTATADDLLTSAGATNSTIEVLKQNVDMFTPPSCANGFELSENLRYGPATFKLVALETDPGSDPGNTLQEYIAITGLIAP